MRTLLIPLLTLAISVPALADHRERHPYRESCRPRGEFCPWGRLEPRPSAPPWVPARWPRHHRHPWWEHDEDVVFVPAPPVISRLEPSGPIGIRPGQVHVWIHF